MTTFNDQIAGIEAELKELRKLVGNNAQQTENSEKIPENTTVETENTGEVAEDTVQQAENDEEVAENTVQQTENIEKIPEDTSEETEDTTIEETKNDIKEIRKLSTSTGTSVANRTDEFLKLVYKDFVKGECSKKPFPDQVEFLSFWINLAKIAICGRAVRQLINLSVILRDFAMGGEEESLISLIDHINKYKDHIAIEILVEKFILAKYFPDDETMEKLKLRVESDLKNSKKLKYGSLLWARYRNYRTYADSQDITEKTEASNDKFLYYNLAKSAHCAILKVKYYVMAEKYEEAKEQVKIWIGEIPTFGPPNWNTIFWDIIASIDLGKLYSGEENIPMAIKAFWLIAKNSMQ